MEDESWKIRAIILRKLLKFGKIGGAHTEARNAAKGFPSDKIGQAKKELEWLIKKIIYYASQAPAKPTFQ